MDGWAHATQAGAQAGNPVAGGVPEAGRGAWMCRHRALHPPGGRTESMHMLLLQMHGVAKLCWRCFKMERTRLGRRAGRWGMSRKREAEGEGSSHGGNRLGGVEAERSGRAQRAGNMSVSGVSCQKRRSTNNHRLPRARPGQPSGGRAACCAPAGRPLRAGRAPRRGHSLGF